MLTGWKIFRLTFQLTRSRGAWRSNGRHCGRYSTFQLTRSRGAWQNKAVQFCCKCHFNSHAHVERDHTHYRVLLTLNISTHTLTWSVTCRRVFQLWLEQISTHTLTWSVTIFCFDKDVTIDISTHTLTWSVTFLSALLFFFLPFQLTRSRGAWRASRYSRPLPKKFQLTRSRGAWLFSNFLVATSNNISTHTLTWSVTTSPFCMYELSLFQLTRSRGAWRTAS